MHYNDIDNAKDKIIHLLYAGFVCGYYNECIDECINEFGEEKTKESQEVFEKNFKANCKEIA